MSFGETVVNGSLPFRFGVSPKGFTPGDVAWSRRCPDVVAWCRQQETDLAFNWTVTSYGCLQCGASGSFPDGCANCHARFVVAEPYVATQRFGIECIAVAPADGGLDAWVTLLGCVRLRSDGTVWRSNQLTLLGHWTEIVPRRYRRKPPSPQ